MHQIQINRDINGVFLIQGNHAENRLKVKRGKKQNCFEMLRSNTLFEPSNELSGKDTSALLKSLAKGGKSK